MSNELIKDITPPVPAILAVPATPGTFGTPGLPGTPGYCLDQQILQWISFYSQMTFGYIGHLPPATDGTPYPITQTVLPTTPPTLLLLDSAGHSVSSTWWNTHGSFVLQTVHRCVDAVPGTLGTAGTPGDPGSPGSAAVPADYHRGWNAGAVSIDVLTGNGQYQFSVPVDVVGVVTGFNTGNTGSGYVEIKHGLYFASGTVRVVESGFQRSPHVSYIGTDVFSIVRRGTQVRYFKNTTLLYTSLVASVGTVMADASEYFGDDEIVDASITATVAASFAGDSGSVNEGLGGPGGFGPGGSSGTGGSDSGTGSGASVDPISGLPAPPSSNPANQSGSSGPESVGDIGPSAGRFGVDGFGVQAIGAASGSVDGSGNILDGSGNIEGFVRMSIDDIGVLVSGPDTGIDGAEIEGSVSIDLGPLTAQGVSLVPPSGITGIGVAGIDLEEIETEAIDDSEFAPDFAAVATALDDLAILAIGLSGGLGETSIALDLSVFAADSASAGAVNINLLDVEVAAFDNADLANDDLFVTAQTSPPFAFALFTASAVGSLNVTARPSAPTAYLHGGMEVTATPAAPTASMTGFIGGVLSVNARPRAPSAAMVGSAALMLNATCEPAAPSAAAVLTAELALYVAAALPSAPSATMTGSVASLLTVYAETTPPTAYMHGGMEVTAAPLSNPSASMVALVGALLRINAQPSAPSAEATLVQSAVLNVYAEPSAPYMLPAFNVLAQPAPATASVVFVVSATPTYEGYSITLLPTPDGVETLTTHLTVFPFDHLVRWGSTYYGINATGIYELAGDTYDAVPIVATGKTAFDDLETQALKRPRAARVTGEVEDDFAVALVTSRTAQTEYQPCFDGDGLRTHRAKLERGYRLSHVAYGFTNAEGKFFRLNTFAPENDVQKRTQGE